MSLTISTFILSVQVCGQIPELVDSVAQHCHQDPHLFLSNCYHWWCLPLQAGRKMAAAVPDITAEPKYCPREMKGHFSPLVLSLRSDKFCPKTILQTSLHGSLARVALHAFLELLIGKRNGITFRLTRPSPRAGAGLRAPWGTWLYGREAGEY